MAKFQDVVFCDHCGVELTWTPYYTHPTGSQPGIRRGEYCCKDCADGYRCKCGERSLLDDERRQREPSPEEPL